MGLTRRVINNLFRFSFIGRITEIKESNTAILANSRTVQYFKKIYENFKKKIVDFLKTSKWIGLITGIKEEIYYFPLKIVSGIIITAVVVNLVLLVILPKDVNLWGYFLRVLLLFIGIYVLFSRADWKDLKESSFLLRCIKK